MIYGSSDDLSGLIWVDLDLGAARTASMSDGEQGTAGSRCGAVCKSDR